MALRMAFRGALVSSFCLDLCRYVFYVVEMVRMEFEKGWLAR
jgi:hypothetical protein